jgi:hypothetical protein
MASMSFASSATKAAVEAGSFVHYDEPSLAFPAT